MQLAVASRFVPPGGPDRRPLPVAALGTLRLQDRDAQGRGFLSAASGIAAAGGALWAVSDEFGMLARFPAPTEAARLLPGLPHAGHKPDLEALVRLPALAEGSASTLLALGSGTNGHRMRGIVQPVDAAGAGMGPPRVVDLAPLLAELDSRLPLHPNIEGAAWRDAATGAELLLFHRGQLAGDRNVVFRLRGAAVMDALQAGSPLPPAAILGQHDVDLGRLGGERLAFSDARALPDGRIAFTASAEAGDGSGNGAIRGSAVGTLDPDLRLTSLRPLDGPARKVEGIESARELDPAAPAGRYLLVTDADDPTRPAELLEVDLEATATR